MRPHVRNAGLGHRKTGSAYRPPPERVGRDRAARHHIAPVANVCAVSRSVLAIGQPLPKVARFPTLANVGDDRGIPPGHRYFQAGWGAGFPVPGTAPFTRTKW